ncbi:MAG TPA: CDP-alcohol phosphatidyltransferase family protein [Actinomycetota bacterium]|nr:CDP-alcohol phosphatidyltransferase family protein [Actinomycetota bacterium]
MGIYAIKPAFQRSLIGTRDRLVNAGVSADALTLLALLLSIAGGVCLAISDRARWTLLIVPLLAMGRITLNALDGMVAVAASTASPFGEVKNEVADRLSDIAWFTGLSFAIEPILGMTALVVVLLNSYIGTVSKAAGGPRLYDGIMGKADRMGLLSIAAPLEFGRVLGLNHLSIFAASVIGMGLVTSVQRLVAARRHLVNKDAA